MIKFALAQSVSKQYLSMQKSMRRNKKLVSTAKLLTVSVIFLGVLGVYASNITIASTKGYFHRQETIKNDELTFERSIVQLDILQLEKKLLNQLQENSSGSTRYGSSDRIQIITPGVGS
jgi:uncharacterized protein YydD (DUF2326 family)